MNKNELLQSYDLLVRKTAMNVWKFYKYTDVEYEELLQEGYVALFEAETYAKSLYSGQELNNYFASFIKGCLLNYAKREIITRVRKNNEYNLVNKPLLDIVFEKSGDMEIKEKVVLSEKAQYVLDCLVDGKIPTPKRRGIRRKTIKRFLHDLGWKRSDIFKVFIEFENCYQYL
jgi:DNA-directed RNA polymerase specialized sigma subunit